MSFLVRNGHVAGLCLCLRKSSPLHEFLQYPCVPSEQKRASEVLRAPANPKWQKSQRSVGVFVSSLWASLTKRFLKLQVYAFNPSSKCFKIVLFQTSNVSFGTSHSRFLYRMFRLDAMLYKRVLFFACVEQLSLLSCYRVGRPSSRLHKRMFIPCV